MAVPREPPEVRVCILGGAALQCEDSEDSGEQENGERVAIRSHVIFLVFFVLTSFIITSDALFALFSLFDIVICIIQRNPSM